MSEVSNLNECFLPLEQCGNTFLELNNKYWKKFQKKETRNFEKIEKEWLHKLCDERQDAVEVYPCATKFYHQETLNCEEYIVNMPTIYENQCTHVKCFRLLFNMINFDPEIVTVSCLFEKFGLLVEVKSSEYQASAKRSRQPYAFARYFKISPQIDITKLKATISSDKLLLIEAPLVNETLQQISDLDATSFGLPDRYSTEHKNLRNKDDFKQQSTSQSFIKYDSKLKDCKPMPPNQLSLLQKSFFSDEKTQKESFNPDRTNKQVDSSKEASPKGVTDTDSASKTSSDASSSGKELKVGVPIFRDEKDVRRMYLMVDVGTEFTRDDIIVKILKENRIQISAKRKVKIGEREDNIKFRMNYELGEKVDPFSLKAGLTKEKKLVVTALAKEFVRGRVDSKGELLTDQEVSCNDSKN